MCRELKKRTQLWWWLSLLLYALLSVPAHAAEPVVRIASASSMRFVLEELLQAYKSAQTDKPIQAVYGSSGNLYRQIVQGAPYDLFLSADNVLVEKLSQQKNITTQSLGPGALVLYRHSDQPIGKLSDEFVASVTTGTLHGADFKVAIANPSHAPYGKAAQQALQNMQLWDSLKPKLVIAEKVSQAAQFARSGAVGFALISESLASSIEGQYEAIPNEFYDAVNHSIALLVDSEAGSDFLEFLKSDRAVAVLSRYGLHQ